MTLNQMKDILTNLEKTSALRADTIIKDDEEVPFEMRTYSAGANLAYSFCLLLLSHLEYN